MKKIQLKILLVTSIACSGVITRPQIALSQVDMSILTEVAESCQKDTSSSTYYKQMQFDNLQMESFEDTRSYYSDFRLRECIYHRYYYSLLQLKLPWLSSTGEITSGYPGLVAISQLSLGYGTNRESLLDCIASKDSFSGECNILSDEFILGENGNKIRDFYYNHISSPKKQTTAIIYTCPSCVVAYDNVNSGRKITGNFIRWFLSIDKLKRREVLSFLYSTKEQGTNDRGQINEESEIAVREYQETREKIKQQEINRRREEVLGN